MKKKVEFEFKLKSKVWKIVATRDLKGQIEMRAFVEKPARLKGQETAMFFFVFEMPVLQRRAEYLLSRGAA